MIDVTPADFLPIPIARQEQIIAVINDRLAKNPMQGFCFMGSPGTGKTFLMKAIQRAVWSHIRASNFPESTCIVPRICTLADWQENNRRRVIGERTDSHLDAISAEQINEIASRNVLYSSAREGRIPLPLWSLHYFIDEFDSQPTMSEFSAARLQSFINACYENAPRIRSGNEQSFVQLVIAMNKSWPEFVESYGLHIARRIAEMCLRIDFNKEVAECMAVQQREEEKAKREDEIDDLFGKYLVEG